MMIKRVLFLITGPLWLVIFGLFALQLGIRSELVWIKTGRWLLPDELPKIWMDRAADRLEDWIREQVTA